MICHETPNLSFSQPHVPFLAAVRGELVPVLVDLGLRLALDEEREAPRRA